jgi:5'-3' exonuclease
MIALIDADSILYLSLPKKANPDQTYEECCDEIRSRVEEMITTVNADEYCLFLTDGKCFRYKDKKSSKEYKLSRKKYRMPPIFYAMKEYMKQNFNTYVCKDLEADDLVSILKTELDEDTVICSPDKDVLYQNAGTHYNYRTREFITTTKEEANKFLFLQLGMGDPGDGIAGIEGVGEKTVLKWFEEIKDGKYHEIILDKYIDKYGIHEGINRYFETFTMVYILSNWDDVMRELNYIPEGIEFLSYKKEL